MLLQLLTRSMEGCRAQLLMLVVGSEVLQQSGSFLAAGAGCCDGGVVGSTVQLLPGIAQALLHHPACQIAGQPVSIWG